ncbi:MAG: helix-turn-helix domain-containing protein [Microbacterium sp.]
MNIYELAVYTVLLRYRNPTTGTCYPGMTTIADLGRMSLKSAERAVKGLEEVHGVISVDRRASLKNNQPNIYTVALPAKTRPAGMAKKTARGTRIPRRAKTTDSESVGKRPKQADSTPVEHVTRHEPTDSESVPTDSESVPPQTPSLTKKTNHKKTNEEDVTPTFSESACEPFSFDLPEPPKATERQVAYLKDLAIHIGYQTGGGIPKETQLDKWRKLTSQEADKLIHGYKKALGRPDDGIYPEPGEPEYDALSTVGREFAESGGDPDSVWEYGWVGKENSA